MLLEDLVNDDPRSFHNTSGRPRAPRTADLDLFPVGTFIAPLRRNILPEHWQHHEDGPSRPALARTMSWPPDNQYDPTIDETKQRWGTPDWSSADEEEQDEEDADEDESEDESLATDDDDDVQVVVPYVRLLIAKPLLWLLSARWLDYERPQVPNNWRVLATDVKTLLRWLYYVLIIQQLKWLHSITWLTNHWTSLPPRLKYSIIQWHDCFADLRIEEGIYFYDYWHDAATEWFLPWWPTTLVNWTRQKYQFWFSFLGPRFPAFIQWVLPQILQMIIVMRARRLQEDDTPGGTEWD